MPEPKDEEYSYYDKVRRSLKLKHSTIKYSTMILTLFFSLLLYMCQSGSKQHHTENDPVEISQEENTSGFPTASESSLKQPPIKIEQATQKSETEQPPGHESPLVTKKRRVNKPALEVEKATPDVVQEGPDMKPGSLIQKDVPEHTGGILVDEPTMILDIQGPDHGIFNDLLQARVSESGAVDYSGIKSDPSKLNAYLDILKSNPPSGNWSANARLAYWINVYNAFTIKLIVDNFPVSSITDLHNGKPWDKSWISIGAESYSLNDIEHKIIRPTFNDARIHFAVNCAAKSCPPLANIAYTESNVQNLLEERTKEFINDNQYNSISKSEAQVSKIFDWYGEDFGDLRSYLNKYTSQTIDEGTEIAFVEYDWKLNN